MELRRRARPAGAGRECRETQSLVLQPNCSCRTPISWLLFSLACYASVQSPALQRNIFGGANAIPADLTQAAGLWGSQRSALLGILLMIAGGIGAEDSAASNGLNLIAPLAVFSNDNRLDLRIMS